MAAEAVFLSVLYPAAGKNLIANRRKESNIKQENGIRIHSKFSKQKSKPQQWHDSSFYDILNNQNNAFLVFQLNHMEEIQMYVDLSGLWQADIGDGKVYSMQLPGTLDENRIGHKDLGQNQWHPDAALGNAEEGFDENAPIATRFTRKYTFEGETRLTRRISFTPEKGKRVFLEAERARCLRLLVDGKEVPHFTEGTLSTPHVFEVTGLLTGDNEITFLSDNSYPGLPHDAIVYSSAATDETQTNWNGVLGYLRLRVEEPVFLSSLRIYPDREGNTLTVQAEVSSDRRWSGTLWVESDALKKEKFGEHEYAGYKEKISVQPGRTRFVLEKLPLADCIFRWDMEEGNLYELTAYLSSEEKSEVELISRTEAFGVRTFGDNGRGRLALNGRVIFLRSEANCCEFPETGHPPMTVEEWMDVLARYRSYGINCMRFHSHCPPEAAFIAADRMGMLMQPELSHWDPVHAFEAPESYAYYLTELKQVILALANHPSFVMLTFGNELAAGPAGHSRMDSMLALARKLDPTRLYADSSNAHYGDKGVDPESDFFASQKYYDHDLRGTHAGGGEDGALQGYINNRYPDAAQNYDESMAEIRKVYARPVFSFEVGQFEVLPDFRELEAFQGISDPANLRLVQERVKKAGISAEEWKKQVEATGEISRLAYREEIEAAMRTKELSGISLLGLQDFPGQGTALVGMMNSHLEPKPYLFAEPAKFQAFFRDQLPLALLPRYTWENTEELTVPVKIANYGKTALSGRVQCTLWADAKDSGTEETGELIAGAETEEGSFPPGTLTEAGCVKLSLESVKKPSRLTLKVSVDGAVNHYPVWVYPPVSPKNLVCPENVYETQRFDEKARSVLAAGGCVYLTPPSTKEALPKSIRAQFTTDFWSVGTFARQAGGMGQLIDSAHPLFEDFPTDSHTDWQWWPMASQRAVILPKRIRAIITEMDSYAYLRPMAQLFECRCGGGRLLFSSMGLQDLQQYPEARALLSSIYRYLAGGEFAPEQELDVETVASLVAE